MLLPDTSTVMTYGTQYSRHGRALTQRPVTQEELWLGCSTIYHSIPLVNRREVSVCCAVYDSNADDTPVLKIQYITWKGRAPCLNRLSGIQYNLGRTLSSSKPKVYLFL